MNSNDYWELNDKDIRNLSKNIGIDFDILKGKDLKSKVLSLQAYVKTSNKEDEVRDYLNKFKFKNMDDEKTKIFISHSSKDVKIAKALLEVIKAAYNIPSNYILCTSVPGYTLGIGDKVSDELLRKVRDADIVIGLVSPNSLNSVFTMFEFGARWGSGKPFLPVAIDGRTISSLNSPLKDYNVANASCKNSIKSLISDIGEHLKDYQKENEIIYEEKIDDLIKSTSNSFTEQDSKICKFEVEGIKQFVVEHRNLNPIELLAKAKKEVIFHASIYPSYASDANYQNAILQLLKNKAIKVSFIFSDTTNTKLSWTNEFAKVLRSNWDAQSFQKEVESNIEFLNKPIPETPFKPRNLSIYITNRMPLEPMVIIDNDILLGHYCHSTVNAPNGLWLHLHCDKLSGLLEIYRRNGIKRKYNDYKKNLTKEELAIVRYVEDAIDAMENICK